MTSVAIFRKFQFSVKRRILRQLIFFSVQTRIIKNSNLKKTKIGASSVTEHKIVTMTLNTESPAKGLESVNEYDPLKVTVLKLTMKKFFLFLLYIFCNSIARAKLL